MVDDTFVLLGV